MLFTGHCHCGNIRFEFGSAFTPTSLALRACQCSFCRAHGAVTVSDPAGQARLFIGERERVQYYRFGLNVTDMLICTHCGCYVAAVMQADGRHYATLNANLFDLLAELTVAPVPVSYASENAEQRIARRRRQWTPAELRLSSG